MLHQTVKFIRQKFHPLATLRKNKYFVEVLMPHFDFPVRSKLYKVKWKVSLRLARHLSLLLGSRSTESGIGSLFVAISKTFHPQIFWDVGANIGYYSWLLLSLNPEAKAVLFEPDPDNAQLIEQTITEASLKNAHLIPRAISDTQGSASFALDKASSATGSLITEQTFNERLLGHKPECIVVDTISLDHFWKNQPAQAPDLIKIDVEMAEHLVFAGARMLIKEHQPIIVFECCAANKVELCNWLTSLGYILIAADYFNQPLESAYNFLAPPTK